MIGFDVKLCHPKVYMQKENILHDFPNIKYYFSPINVISFGKDEIYLISGLNRELAKNDILSMNAYIKKAARFTGSPYAKIKNVSFDVPKDFFIKGEWSNSVYFTCYPYTATGKLSKYPLTLHFSTQKTPSFQTEFDRFVRKLRIVPIPVTNKIYCIKCIAPKYVFGRIYYLGNGEIGKAHIVMKKNLISLTIDCGIKDSVFQILKIKSYNGKTFSTDELFNYNKK